MSWIELVAQRRPPVAPNGMQPPENAKAWFRMENSAEDLEATDVYVYDSIGGWFGMYADEFIEALGEVTTSKINLRLNSPGGSVFEGIAIANAIRSHPATVTVYVDSLAASIASVIAMAGDRLVMMPQSQIMVHNASGACYGDATEMTKMADLLDKQSRNIAEAYAQHTGRPLAEWQQYMADETWFTADEALAAGLADEVMPMKPKKGDDEDAEEPAATVAAQATSWDLSMYTYAGRNAAPEPKIAPKVKLQDGERVLPGMRITAAMADGLKALADKTTPPSGDASKVVVFNGFDTDLVRMIREAIHNELISITPTALDATDEGEQATTDEAPEAITDEQPLADDSPPEATDTSPPEEEEEGEESPPDEEGEPADKADDWNQLVGFLVSPATSPSADDVFAQLKEAW